MTSCTKKLLPPHDEKRKNQRKSYNALHPNEDPSLRSSASQVSLAFDSIEMNSFIQIIRRPYEEPYHLNLVVTASNESVRSSLEFYLDVSSLVEWADAMETFPKHQNSIYLFELGSERPEDRFAFYFRLRLFTTDARGHCAIQFRFNNNTALPDREISEFCILSEAAQINRLGSLCREFSKLRQTVLLWSLTAGNLYDTIQEAEQSWPEDAFKATRL